MVSLFVITTFTESNAQVVTLPEKTAKFYFERHYRAKALDELIILKEKRISNLERQLLLRDSVISTYRFDKGTYESMLAIRELQNKAIEEDVKKMKKEAGKQKFQKKLIMVLGVGLLTLSLIYD